MQPYLLPILNDRVFRKKPDPRVISTRRAITKSETQVMHRYLNLLFSDQYRHVINLFQVAKAGNTASDETYDIKVFIENLHTNLCTCNVLRINP